MGGSRVGTGGSDPPEKSQKIRVFRSNTGQISTKPAFNVGPSSANLGKAI